jgi:UDP-N-acetylglucosamine 2-epimerase (non-hydrolysing)
MLDPLGYFEFLGLQEAARFALTDSGGVQEETTILGVPCLTLRENTERPVTATHGTNRVVGTDPSRILAAWEELKRSPVPTVRPPLWDGRSAGRVVEVLLRKYGSSYLT